MCEDRRLIEVVSSRRDARAHRVERDDRGVAVDTALPARYWVERQVAPILLADRLARAP